MIYLGLDVAKAKLDACLLLDETQHKRKTKVSKHQKWYRRAFAVDAKIRH